MRYQFQSEQGNIAFKPQYFTDAIKVLIIANVAMFLFRYLALSQFDLAEIFFIIFSLFGSLSLTKFPNGFLS
jgi:hypothetical protein